ncbi:MAG TPA: CehA/McbA family metallohydrolase [Thermoplasmata archaeon]|nr:CehA/McbA family metallohydrolase [Thermoplasmata archaeon]
MRLDLHIHSAHSRDGTASPGDIVRRCRQLGLAGLAITDHNAIKGSLEAQALGRAEGLLVVTGSEGSSSDGHVLAYGVREVIPRGLSAAETVDRIRAVGGIAVAAHPVRFPSGIGLEIAERVSFDGLEVLNGGNSARANRCALKIAERMGMPQTGGSDAHRLREIGRSYTSFEHVFTEDQVLDSMRKGLSRPGGRSRTDVEGVIYSVEMLVEWLRGGMNRL